MLYEIAVIQRPTSKEREDGKSEILLVPPYPKIASNEKAAGMQAVIDNRDRLPADLSLVEIVVRPFV